jgi:hypothetical protein
MGRRWLVVVRTRLSGFGDRLKGGNAIALKHLVFKVRNPNTVVIGEGIKGAIAPVVFIGVRYLRLSIS